MSDVECSGSVAIGIPSTAFSVQVPPFLKPSLQHAQPSPSFAASASTAQPSSPRLSDI